MLCGRLGAGGTAQSRGRMVDSPLGALALGKELRVPVAARCHVTQTATDSAAHLVMSATGHRVAKAAIYTLAWNNHSPGRNDRLEDKIL